MHANSEARKHVGARSWTAAELETLKVVAKRLRENDRPVRARQPGMPRGDLGATTMSFLSGMAAPAASAAAWITCFK